MLSATSTIIPNCLGVTTMPEHIEREALVAWLDSVDGIIANGTVEAPTLYKQVITDIKQFPAADVEVVRHGEWELIAHEENVNYRWNVTAECSECHFSKGEVYAGFFPNFPKNVAQSTVLDYAKAVKLDNYCPNCGAKMDGKGEGE